MIEKTKIIPLPENIGYGFTFKGSKEILDNLKEIYVYKKEGIFDNFYFTKDCYSWPQLSSNEKQFVMDAFSPNMNKLLHIGHLRNLALASSFSRIFFKSKFIAFLGYSLGEHPEAFSSFEKWCNFLNYHPEIYSTKDFKDTSIFQNGKDEQNGCLVFNNGMKDLIAVKSNGDISYIGYDVLLKNKIKPDWYLTGSEQTNHFNELNLKEKHLPMGLVIGNGKISSRKEDENKSNIVSSKELLNHIKSKLKDSINDESKEKLAWNIICWNLLSVRREENIKYKPDEWTHIESPGLKISYTLARLQSVFKKIDINFNHIKNNDEKYIEIFANCSYVDYYLNMSKKNFSPHFLAQHLYKLSKIAGNWYQNGGNIVNGNILYQKNMNLLMETIKKIMNQLGMFVLDKV